MPLQVATIGLASFALVLALVEQIVLEVIESNVKRGSSVYERDHVCHFNHTPLICSCCLSVCDCIRFASEQGVASLIVD